MATGMENVSFHSNPQKRQCQRILKLLYNAFNSCTSKVILNILQGRFQQYVNCELPDIQAGFGKGRRTRDQIAKICWIMEKAREFQKKSLLLLYWLCQRLWLYKSNHNKLWKILQEMRISDHLTYLLKNLDAGQWAIARTRHGRIDWFKQEME